MKLFEKGSALFPVRIAVLARVRYRKVVYFHIILFTAKFLHGFYTGSEDSHPVPTLYERFRENSGVDLHTTLFRVLKSDSGETTNVVSDMQTGLPIRSCVLTRQDDN